jgi:hypothetical protein
MTRTIVTPTEIEHPFYKGQMEFTPAAIEEATRKGLESTSVDLKSTRPVVTLGEPQCWNLASLAREKGKILPAELVLLLRDADFYLVQLACSLRPGRDSQVTWARLDVYLRPKTGPDNPIAFDLYPRDIYDETKTEVKVSIGPSLKFAAFEGTTVEGKLGEVVTTVEFRKLEPVVIGYGPLQSNPGWDFEKHKDQPLRGAKFGYLIVKKPHNAEAVRLTMNITAEVAIRRGLLCARVLGARVAEKDQEHLTRIVCAD